MKSIAILDTFNYKSTGKIGEGLLNYCINSGKEAVFCYGRGKKVNDSNHYKIDNILEVYVHGILGRLFGNQGGYSWFATKRLIRYFEKNDIKTIYCINLHGYYLNQKLLFEYIIKKQIKAVFIMADESAYLGKCGYSDGCDHYLNGCVDCKHVRDYPKSLFLDRASEMFSYKDSAYSRMNNPVFVGPLYNIEKALTSRLIQGKETKVIDEAIDVNLYHPRKRDSLLEQLGVDKNKKIMVCVAPYPNDRKGCQYYIEAARRLEDNDEYVFVHVGFNGDVSDCPRNYIPIGYVGDQNLLAEYYSVADLFVFPSLDDTMPNACLEALACGSPLLCFNISGMPYIADETTATFIAPRNVDEMVNVILSTEKKTEEIIGKCREYALKRYDNQDYFRKLLELSAE